MSAGCERVLEVEDLVLGLGGPEDLEAHLEACADCMDAKAMFVAERALFEARPEVPAPALVLPRAPLLRRIGASRVIPALAGIAASIAALLGGHLKDDCDTPAPSALVAIPVTSDEPLTCKAPESPAPAMTLASHDTAPLACIPSESATCDVPPWQRVTFSRATP